MYIALIVVHVVLCILLIVTILLQAGRGGGLTEMFGGDTAQSVLGTQAPALLKKITEVSAIGFIVTSLALGMITARRGQSLFEGPVMPALPLEGEASQPFTSPEGTQEPMDTAELPPVEPVTFPGADVMPVDETDVARPADSIEMEEAQENLNPERSAQDETGKEGEI
jgi:preprotein translocase subunit SecG